MLHSIVLLQDALKRTCENIQLFTPTSLHLQFYHYHHISGAYCFVHKCLFVGTHFTEEEIFKGTVCCFHPHNTFNGTESGKKEILKCSPKIEFLLFSSECWTGPERPGVSTQSHTSVPGHPLARRGMTAMLQLATKI